MPPRGLPGNANIEQLKKAAKSFQRAVRAGDAGAADVAREFHPRLGQATPGEPGLVGFSRADAQLVIARRFGFPSWPKLKAHLDLVQAYSRSPHSQPIGEPIAGEPALVDEFLRLACLTYGGDDPARWARAGELLEQSPHLATASIHTIAAVGDVPAARELLDRDPAQARLEGGPHDWEPLLYLAYARLPTPPRPGRSALELARVLLDHGADPNAGYLWEGLSPPFTVLTGAFGRGEADPPPHPDCPALARLLLDRGADPNDAQTLYNRHWDPDDAWIRLLFEFGLGTGDGGRWHRLLAPHPTPAQMLEDQLIAAARHGFADRVRLLLDHEVDPDGLGTRHPIYAGRTPAQEAGLWGYPRIVGLLEAAGARSGLDELDVFLATCMEGDRPATERLLAGDPTLLARAIARRPDQLARAAEKNSLDTVVLLIDLGFDVNATSRVAPLHEAAMRGNLEVIRLLVEHGADPNARDRSYDATPAGWAEHHGQTEAARYLAALERRA